MFLENSVHWSGRSGNLENRYQKRIDFNSYRTKLSFNISKSPISDTKTLKYSQNISIYMQPFIIKYQPKKPNEIIGPDITIKKLKDFVVNFKKQRKNAALLYGPSGVGKTISVHVLANELNLEILEVNASDVRNADEINSMVGSAVGQMSLFAKGKIILVDEIDGLSGTKDRGGLLAIINIIEKSSFPIILTATNPWDYKFNKLKTITQNIKFFPVF